MTTIDIKTYDSAVVPAVVDAIQDRKGKKITVIDLSGVPVSSARQYIICQGNSTSQVSAIADNVEEYVRHLTGRKPYCVDGTRNSQWIVMDYGDVMVHVFLPDFRSLYNLEELWGDGKITEIPDID